MCSGEDEARFAAVVGVGEEGINAVGEQGCVVGFEKEFRDACPQHPLASSQ